ncbi:MAG: hypothetical protein ACJ8GW_16260 [Massilia sp.]
MKRFLLVLLAIPALSQATVLTMPTIYCGRSDMTRPATTDEAALKRAAATEDGSAESWIKKTIFQHQSRNDDDRDRAAEIALAKMHDMPVSARTASALNALAAQYFQETMCAQGDAVLELAIPMLGQTQGWSSPETIAALNRRIASARARNSMPALEGVLLQAVAALPSERKLGLVYLTLGELQLRKKDYLAAEKTLTSAMTVFAASAEDNLQLRTSMLLLSGVKYGQMRYTEGEALRVRAYAIAPNASPQRETEVPRHVAKFRQGDVEGALAAVREDIDAKTEMLSNLQVELDAALAAPPAAAPAATSAPLVQQLRNRQFRAKLDLLKLSLDQADILHSQGKFSLAETGYTTAEGMAVSLSPALLPRIRRARAHLYHSQGRLPEAIALQESLLAARTPIDSNAHPDAIDSRSELADMCEQIGKFDCVVQQRELLVQAYGISQQPIVEAKLENQKRLAAAYVKLGQMNPTGKAAEQIAPPSSK